MVNFDTGVILIDCALLYSPKRGVYEGSTKTGNQNSTSNAGRFAEMEAGI